MEYYSYVNLDLRKPGKFIYQNCGICFFYQPFYVGFGHGSRYKSQNHKNAHVIHSMNLLGDPESYTLLVFKSNDSLKALEFEKILIAEIGRKDLNRGPLLNLTDGGEGTVGWIMPEETKSKISKSNLGKKRTEKFKDGCRKRNLGKILTEEHKQKISKSLSGKPKNGKKWKIIFPDGKIEIVTCLESFCKAHGLHGGTFRRGQKSKGFTGEILDV